MCWYCVSEWCHVGIMDPGILLGRALLFYTSLVPRQVKQMYLHVAVMLLQSNSACNGLMQPILQNICQAYLAPGCVHAGSNRWTPPHPLVLWHLSLAQHPWAGFLEGVSISQDTCVLKSCKDAKSPSKFFQSPWITICQGVCETFIIYLNGPPWVRSVF